MFAQTYPTTAPIIDPASPAWANAFIGVCAAIVTLLGALAVFLPVLSRFMKDVREGMRRVEEHAVEAKASAAEAKGATGAIQDSMTRFSARQNEQSKEITSVAMKIDPKGSSESGPAVDRPQSP